MKFTHVSDVDRLVEEQSESWPLLSRGMDGLKSALTRKVDVNGYDVYLRHLPHRIVSTTAKVDPEFVAARPCFLCSANLPPEEKGLDFNDELTIYCNPFPILPRHLTIVHKEHRPQRLAGQVSNMLALAEALHGDIIIYNGARCGASAPDHMHFQACSSLGVPLVSDVRKADSGRIPNYGRTAIVLRNPQPSDLEFGETEPMVNIVAFRDVGDTIVVIFPRGKHRPDVFHSGELTISPASIDLSGIVVVPVLKDFERVTADQIRAIFKEVTEDQG